MNTHTTIEEPVSKERIGKHNNRDIAGNVVFYSDRAKMVIKESSVEKSRVPRGQLVES
jgi:hypothetical protein